MFTLICILALLALAVSTLTSSANADPIHCVVGDRISCEAAANAGDAVAQVNFGYMFQMGKGVPINLKEAVRWYRMSAENGNAVAMANLGGMYENGLGVAQDYTAAMKWYRRSADLGDARGQNAVGVGYDNGRGVSQNSVEAVKWFRLAAGQGFAAAQSNLGLLNDFGRGVQQDFREAIRLYRLAADQGQADAQYRLGVMYAAGHGTSQNSVEAMKWIRLAAENGNEAAKAILAAPAGDKGVSYAGPSASPMDSNGSCVEKAMQRALKETNGQGPTLTASQYFSLYAMPVGNLGHTIGAGFVSLYNAYKSDCPR